MKTGQLWSKNKDDLKKQLDELKTELGSLRVQKIAGGAASKLNRMYACPQSCRSHYTDMTIIYALQAWQLRDLLTSTCAA